MSLLTRELEYFLAICESRNLARAADALGGQRGCVTTTYCTDVPTYCGWYQVPPQLL